MFLLVNPNGSKYFRLDYRFDGKRKTLALGVYPEISLKQSREKRDDAKQQIANGIEPNENKKAIKLAKADSAANSFEVLAREWFERNMTDKVEQSNFKTNIDKYEAHLTAITVCAEAYRKDVVILTPLLDELANFQNHNRINRYLR